MKSFFRIGFFALVFLISGCLEEKTESDVFSLKFGTTCGWCAGQEYITLTDSEIKYERNIPCGENKGMTIRYKTLTAAEWNSVFESFDNELFKTLDYNECNVCVDGCDEIIEITDGDYVHEITYSPSVKIEEIEELREILSGIMDEMRAMN